MPCFKPLDAWRPEPGSLDRKLIFSGSRKPDLQVPCGQCVGCRLERSRQWAVRCMHEAKMHDKNCFVTLTYSDSALKKLSDEDPTRDPHSLHYRDFQLFMKRLRKKYGEGIRFYMCGEYGDKLGRPHFHACLFGHDFSDKKFWKTTGSKSSLFRSSELEELWPHGFSSVGEVTFESAAYVARYIMKKVSGDAAEQHYTFREPFHRGNIKPPSRVYPNVSEAGYRHPLVSEFLV